MPFLYVIAALILLVTLHELGHFLAARAVGIRATKFYLFFPPALFKRQVGDVEYGIGAIPAGGFVRLPGMFEPVPADVSQRLGWDLEAVLPLADPDAKLQLDAARRAVAHAPDADGILAPLGEIHTELTQLAVNTSTSESRKQIERAIDRVQGMRDDAHPRAYWRASLWRRMAVIFAGPFVNLLIALVVLIGFWLWLSPTYSVTKPFQSSKIVAGSPAAEAGLTTNSRITGWNGPVVGADYRELRQRIDSSRGAPVELSWRTKDGTEITRTIQPRELEHGERKRIGVLLPRVFSAKVSGHERTAIGYATRQAVRDMREITWGNLSRLPRVFFDSEVRDDVGSVVGIVQVADDADRAGQMVRYVAIISLVLAIMNLLPLLPLDGGHLLFGVLEAARRGRPMSRAVFERYSMVGLALVLLLFFIGLDNDIARARG